MQKSTLGILAVLFMSPVAPALAQVGKSPEVATVVSAVEIEKVVSAPGGGDREIKIVDHIEYVSMRPDPEKALPAGYVNPALKK